MKLYRHGAIGAGSGRAVVAHIVGSARAVVRQMGCGGQMPELGLDLAGRGWPFWTVELLIVLLCILAPEYGVSLVCVT
jgi:hypothetical protein